MAIELPEGPLTDDAGDSGVVRYRPEIA